MSTTPHVSPEQTRRRLDRLRELVDRRADPHWGIEEVQAVLDRDPDDPATHCPRYAGIVAESGDERVLLEDEPVAIAGEMAVLAEGDIPITPVELIDLDTGESRPARSDTLVWFDGDDAPGRGAAGQAVLIAIQHRHGTSYQLARDDTDAQRRLYDWVAEWWELERTTHYPQLGPMPSDRAGAIESYFEVVEEEFAETETLGLPGGHGGSTPAAPESEASVEWEFYLPDEDRNAGWTNHCYVLQLVCAGNGPTPQDAWRDAVARRQVPDSYDATEPPTVAVRTTDLLPGPDPIEPGAQDPDAPAKPAPESDGG